MNRSRGLHYTQGSCQFLSAGPLQGGTKISLPGLVERDHDRLHRLRHQHVLPQSTVLVTYTKLDHRIHMYLNSRYWEGLRSNT